MLTQNSPSLYAIIPKAMDPDLESQEFSLTDAQLLLVCQGKLHPMAVAGIILFNRGEYFNAHEALEEAWRAESGPIRELYRGILQVGVAYYKIQLGNYPGACKLFERSRMWLHPYPDWCRGVHVKRLKIESGQAETYLRRLSPQHIREFDQHYFKPVELINPEELHAE